MKASKKHGPTRCRTFESGMLSCHMILRVERSQPRCKARTYAWVCTCLSLLCSCAWHYEDQSKQRGSSSACPVFVPPQKKKTRVSKNCFSQTTQCSCPATTRRGPISSCNRYAWSQGRYFEDCCSINTTMLSSYIKRARTSNMTQRGAKLHRGLYISSAVTRTKSSDLENERHIKSATRYTKVLYIVFQGSLACTISIAWNA